MTARKPGESEADFQTWVLGCAKVNGWMVAHFRPAMNAKGQWRTAVQADGAGFPDLCMVRGKELIFAELKSQRGQMQEAQIVWMHALHGARQLAYIWRPSDRPEIERVLSRKEAIG